MDNQQWNNQYNYYRPQMSPEDRNKANMWCTISLLLTLLPSVATLITGISSGLFEAFLSFDEVEVANEIASLMMNIQGLFMGIQGILSTMSSVAAFIIMIYVRCKYPLSTFGKVLMWMYIANIVITLVFTVAIIVACGIACDSCISDCNGDNCAFIIDTIYKGFI